MNNAKVIHLAFTILLSGCIPQYNITHFRAHHYETLVDSFEYEGEKFEVRRCVKNDCPALDTFPNYKFRSYR